MDAWEPPGGDLFDVATALAEMLGDPVTIEDTDTTVLAYSGGDQSVDEARIQTILGRRTPEPFRSALREAGVYRRLATERGVVFADLSDVGIRPRAIVGVRDGDELIGSIWLAVNAPLDAARERTLLDAAPVVAVHLRRTRDTLDAVRAARAGQVEALLAGGEDAIGAARRLGIYRGPFTAVALAPLATAADTARMLDRRAGSLILHLASVAPGSTGAVIGSRIHAVVTVDDTAARRIVADHLARGSDDLVAGVGRTVSTVEELHRSRADADEAAAALRSRCRAGQVAGPAEVLLDAVLLRVGEYVAATGFDRLGPLARLSSFDAAHGAELVRSAAVYLELGGDVRDAALRLHVHPNTLRNRLRKMREACDVDLADPDDRLLLTVMLRVGGLTDQP